MAVITVPDLEFAGFYYPDILKEVMSELRLNKEKLGLTDENMYEVHVQLARSFSLVGHLNNCRLDTVAGEKTLDTAKLLQSVKDILAHQGINLDGASMASAEVLLELTEVTSINQTGFIPELAEFATNSVPPISFETLAETDLDRTDQVSYVFGLQETKSGTDGSVSAASPDVFRRGAADTAFASTDINSHLFLTSVLHAGEYRIVEVIDTYDVRVVKIPGSISPAFQTETTMAWTLKAFTADMATEANTPSSTFSPLGTSTPVAGDAIYVGHKQAMYAALDIDVTTPASGITGVFEYFDNQLSKFNPTAVTDNGDGTLTVNVGTLLGAADRRGAEIILEYLPTGQQEKLTSIYSSSENRVVTEGALGQTAISTDISDYEVTADWVPFDAQSDGSSNFTQDGQVSYTLPQTQYRNWTLTDVNLYDAYWLRYRVVSVSTPTAPVIDRLRIDQGEQYMLVSVTQGESVGPQILGSSDATASQTFTLADTPYVDESETIEVDETGGGTWTAWTAVDSLDGSLANSRHYLRTVSANDELTVKFGDGERGKIPPSGTDNIRATYRIGGDTSGNVGVGEIVSNADGVTGIGSVTNPRAASGWRMKDGATKADIERVKRDKPAEMRTRDTAATAGDCVRLATKVYKNALGVKSVARAVAVDEALGPKSVKLLVVGAGGSTFTAAEKAHLEEWFNGDRFAHPPVYGKLALNRQLTVFNYEPKVVSVVATVTWPGGNRELIRNALLNLLHPLALESDEVTYSWNFGSYVPLSRVYSEIHAVSPNIEGVPVLTLNGSSASVTLGANELPSTTAGNITVNVQG